MFFPRLDEQVENQFTVMVSDPMFSAVLTPAPLA
jgi:hypothetical protein